MRISGWLFAATYPNNTRNSSELAPYEIVVWRHLLLRTVDPTMPVQITTTTTIAVAATVHT